LIQKLSNEALPLRHIKNKTVMSVQEQKEVKNKYYNEAIRYMDNAI
jgi:hypothetical protein